MDGVRKEDASGPAQRPRFVFTSTSLQTGVLWRFARDYAAEWRVGEWPSPELRLSLAVAASASFPPFMSPTRIKPPKDAFRQLEGNDLFNRDYASTLILTDGGVYDNLGLEPVWKRYKTILVSDGGLVTAAEPKPRTNWYSQFRRVLDISLQQGINPACASYAAPIDRSAQVGLLGNRKPVAAYDVGNPLDFELAGNAALRPRCNPADAFSRRYSEPHHQSRLRANGRRTSRVEASGPYRFEGGLCGTADGTLIEDERRLSNIRR